MKLKHILASLMLAVGASAFAQADCDMQIQVVSPDQEDIPASTANMITNRLIRALTRDGVTADENYGQLYLSAKFAHVYTDDVPGPPAQKVVHTEMTLFVADIFGNKIFDSETFDLRGVGTSEQRAFINALTPLNARNKALESFVKRAKRKTITYFDNNYQQLLAQANRAASMRDYEQALYYATLIPACSQGYAAAEAATTRIYQQYIDHQGTLLLNQAEAEFAAMPNGEGARRAYAYLAMIDPQSSAYPASRTLAAEIKKSSKEEYQFEVHQKYEDAQDLKVKQVEAAKAIGVAYGQGQKAQTTNILWK